VQVRDDRLLAGMGDVQAGETQAFGSGQQFGQCVDATTRS
jgi:hypothetical protein